MDQAIHETHKQDQQLYKLFMESRSFLVKLIQWDREWFEDWVVHHPLPEPPDRAQDNQMRRFDTKPYRWYNNFS